MPNRSATDKGRGYVGSPPWHTVVKPGGTVTLHWTHLMPVSPGGLTVERRIMPGGLRWWTEISWHWFAPRCVPVSPVCFKIFKTTGAISRRSPVQHSLSQFNAVLAGVATVWSRLVHVSILNWIKLSSLFHCVVRGLGLVANHWTADSGIASPIPHQLE